jgi:protein involved in polysaccharide export with SLBB domain
MRKSIFMHRPIRLAAATAAVVAMAFVAAVNISSAVAQATAVASPLADYQLSTGDRVRVIVFNQPELTGEYQIDATNTLSLPLVGRVPAGGLKPVELERQLAAKFNEGYLKDASVSVEVVAFRPFYIVGEVKTPGSYPYVWGMSVLNAVALAGGFTYRAKESAFYLLRTAPDGRKTKLDAAQETAVLPGDVITVRERFF